MSHKSRHYTPKMDISIKPQEHLEYINFHKKVDFKKYKHDELIEMSCGLFGKSINLEEKRKILFYLGHLGTVESYRILEKYLKNPDKKLKSWTALCLEECRMFLESDLMNHEKDLIFGGAGGDGLRMRYYIVISSPNNVFTRDDKDNINTAFRAICENLNSLMEKVQFSENYALMTVLIPLDVTVEDVVIDSIHLINSGKKLLRVHYYCTNTSRPTKKEIHQYLKEL